jgi:hypothetical protein
MFPLTGHPGLNINRLLIHHNRCLIHVLTMASTAGLVCSSKAYIITSSSSAGARKKRQMQWSRRGAHLLLQTRTRALDGSLRAAFEHWYPGMMNDNDRGHR